MRVHLIASAIAVAALAHGASAQTAPAANDSNGQTKPPMQPGQQQAAAAQPLPQQIKDKLKREGYSDVSVVAGSYVVKAKDKQGQPVMMLVQPNSLTQITAGAPNAQLDQTGASTSGNAASETGTPATDKGEMNKSGTTK